jgi:hypothetical protein
MDSKNRWISRLLCHMILLTILIHLNLWFMCYEIESIIKWCIKRNHRELCQSIWVTSKNWWLKVSRTCLRPQTAFGKRKRQIYVLPVHTASSSMSWVDIRWCLWVSLGPHTGKEDDSMKAAFLKNPTFKMHNDFVSRSPLCSFLTWYYRFRLHGWWTRNDKKKELLTNWSVCCASAFSPSTQSDDRGWSGASRKRYKDTGQISCHGDIVP